MCFKIKNYIVKDNLTIPLGYDDNIGPVLNCEIAVLF